MIDDPAGDQRRRDEADEIAAEREIEGERPPEAIRAALHRTSHTPGPWTYEADEEDLGGFVIELGDAKGRQTVEQVIEYAKGLFPEDGSQWETAHANACLIAAAPEMLHLLDRLIAAHVGTCGPGPEDRDKFYCEYCGASDSDLTRIDHATACIVTGLRATIAKARVHHNKAWRCRS